MDKSPFPPNARVYAYLRDSGHEHQEESIAQQEHEIRAWCNRRGVLLAQVYKDEATPGSKDENRAALAAMMNALRHGADVEGVVVWSGSRFARNATHAQFYRSEIRKLGYIYHSLTDKTAAGPEALIFEALIDYKNQQFLEDLSIDVKRGLRSLVEDHGCMPGVPPRGFKREKVIIGTRRDGKERVAHRWVIDPETAHRVRRAFELRAAGLSLAQIQKETRLYGSLNSYRTFWPNKLYIGILEYGGKTYPDYCEAIVPLEIWNLVQKMQNHYAGHHHVSAKSKLHPRRVSSRYLLSGIAHCARCGSPLFGRTSKRKSGKSYTAYFCTRAYRQRNCTKQRIPGHTLENAVIQNLTETFLQPNYLAALAAELKTMTAGQKEKLEDERARLAKQLGTARCKLRHVTDAIAASGHSRSLLQRLQQLETEEMTLQNALAQNKAQSQAATPPQIDPDQLAERIRHIRAALGSAELLDKRLVLQALIQRVDVDRENRRIFGTITFYYPPEEPPKANPPPNGGEKVMPISQAPSGPPRYRHTLRFEAPTHYKSRS